MIDAAEIKSLQAPQNYGSNTTHDKWELLRLVGKTRKRLGLTDRTVTVLQALLSFHPETTLDGQGGEIVVFPSNASICARLNGMPCSTMRRHLQHLTNSGLIQRRDSPNGKRFRSNELAFGFDLSPLLARATELQGLALALDQAAARHKSLRLSVSLLRRDLASLAEYAVRQNLEVGSLEQWQTLEADAIKSLRRKQNTDELTHLAIILQQAVIELSDILEIETQILSTNDTQNEHHQQKSKKEDYELEKVTKAPVKREKEDELPMRQIPVPPLTLVQEICLELNIYSQTPISQWSGFTDTAKSVSSMMGISLNAWNFAVDAMGLRNCAVTVGLILERFSEIKSPGAYLMHLSKKARAGAYSPMPQLVAMTRRECAKSSQL